MQNKDPGHKEADMVHKVMHCVNHGWRRYHRKRIEEAHVHVILLC